MLKRLCGSPPTEQSVLPQRQRERERENVLFKVEELVDFDVTDLVDPSLSSAPSSCKLDHNVGNFKVMGSNHK